MIAALIIFLATLETMIPLIVGYLHTPKDMIFLGTTHYPIDYFYYLSEIAQGAYRWMTTVDLYTTEKLSPTLVGWNYVLMGRLMGLFFSPMSIYHASIVILFILLLITAYKLSLLILNSKLYATLALYLFVLFHSFPIIRDGKPSYGDYFSNFAVPRVRFDTVPHHFLQSILSMLCVYLVLQWHKRSSNKNPVLLLSLFIVTFLLASFQPVLWALLVGVTALTTLFSVTSFHNWLPVGAIAIGGLLPTSYLSVITSLPPFALSKAWEASQQMLFSASYVISATGPIYVLALVALPFLLKNSTFALRFVILYALCSYTLFLSPLPVMIGISQVRFMSALTIFCVSVIAAEGLMRLSMWSDNMYRLLMQAKGNKIIAESKKFSFPTAVIFSVLTLLTLTLLPNHVIMLGLATNFDTKNAYQYLYKNDYNLLELAGKHSTPRDTFLVIWPFNVMFPALSGRRSFDGNDFITLDVQKKQVVTKQFFDGSMSDLEMKQFLNENEITYIIAYTWTKKISRLSGVSSVGSSGQLVLYHVTTTPH
jgi:hypothetical protein